MQIFKIINNGLIGFLWLFAILLGLIFIGIIIIALKTGGDPLSQILLLFCGVALVVAVTSLILAKKHKR
jgi:FtsH-binding integral membrane protein